MTGLVAPSAWQLTPMSAFIRKLKQGRFPDHVRFASLYSKADTIVPFPVGMIEDQGRENLVNIEVANVQHHEFLTRKSVYELVRAQLAAAYANVSVVAPDAALSVGANTG